ncbi:MAG: DUF1987 domain-containing protein [Desulfobacteraceae bacterium]|nr:DUF1987 domain-containing protein [Desulfobacteraceae bacterium]
MENLIIRATNDTPGIMFDSKRNQLEIKGKSYSNDIKTFFKPVLDWVKKYTQQPDTRNTTVNLQFIYFNSTTVKPLLEFFDTFEAAARKGKNITVNWYYDKDDDDMLELGEDFKDDVKSVKFNLIPR